MVGRFSVRLHGYVLMPNHYHLIAETPAGNLSRAMQWLNLSLQHVIQPAAPPQRLFPGGTSLRERRAS
jgi:REP element-mobilizing transposase RayT